MFHKFLMSIDNVIGLDGRYSQLRSYLENSFWDNARQTMQLQMALLKKESIPWWRKTITKCQEKFTIFNTEVINIVKLSTEIQQIDDFQQ